MQYDTPLSVAQANARWIGAPQETGSSIQLGGDQQLKPGSCYILTLQRQPEPKLPNFEANFRGLLARSCYNQPKEGVMHAIVWHLAARMIVCSNIDQAEDLYHDASLLPGASTVKHLLTQHNLRVDGPLYLRCTGGQNPLPFDRLDMQEVDKIWFYSSTN